MKVAGATLSNTDYQILLFLKQNCWDNPSTPILFLKWVEWNFKFKNMGDRFDEGM